MDGSSLTSTWRRARTRPSFIAASSHGPCARRQLAGVNSEHRCSGRDDALGRVNALDRPALHLVQPSPDPMGFADPQGELETGITDRTPLADGLRHGLTSVL